MSKAGKFEIDLGGPYPVWCRLRYGEYEEKAIMFSHRELSDLRYAVEKAMQDARLMLKEDKDEV